MIDAFLQICSIHADDAVVFDLPSLTVDRIRDDAEYGGLRIKMRADVDGARVPVQIDIAFGDAIEPGLIDIDMPVLLGLPSPRLRAYPYENGDRGEVSGHGGAGARQHLYEGFLRHLASGAVAPF